MPTAFHGDAVFVIDYSCPQWTDTDIWTEQDRLYFTFLEEGRFEDAVSADWSSIPILGRSENYKIYGSTGNRTINFSLMFAAETVDESAHGHLGNTRGGLNTSVNTLKESRDTTNSAKRTKKDVKSKVDWIRALAYPYYLDSGRMLPPPRVELYFGELFKGITGIITDPVVSWNEPFDISNLVPYFATVSINFTAVNEEPKTSHDVLKGDY